MLYNPFEFGVLLANKTTRRNVHKHLSIAI